MKHRRLWVAVLALTLVFPLAACGGKDASPALTEAATAEPTPTPDPADALVGTWTNADGVGLKFTSDGTLKLSGMGLSLGGDTFTYEVSGDNTLTLTATVGGILSADMEAPYGIVGDTLYIDIGDYSFELTKK